MDTSKQGMKIDEGIVKEKSEFLKQVIDFAQYQKTEILGTGKGFIILAFDNDIQGEDGAGISTAVIGGNKVKLLSALCTNIEGDDSFSELFYKAMGFVALKQAIKNIIRD